METYSVGGERARSGAAKAPSARDTPLDAHVAVVLVLVLALLLGRRVLVSYRPLGVTGT